MNQPDARKFSPDKHATHKTVYTAIAPVALRMGAVRWTVRSPELATDIGDLLRDPDAFLAGKDSLIHNTPLVTMGRVSMPAQKGERWLLRRTNYGKPLAKLRDFFRVSAPIRAFRNALEFEKADIPTPRVLAAGIVRVLQTPIVGYLLMEEISPVSKLAEMPDKHGHISNAAIRGAAEVIARMHERGFVHGDLTIHNVLLDGQLQPWLVDLDRAKSLGGPVDWRNSVEDFFRFARHIVFLDPHMRFAALRLLTHYCNVRGWTGRERDLAIAVLARLRRRVKW